MTASHAHTWQLINAALRRYRCTGCPVIGHALPMRKGIVPYACQHELGDRYDQDGRKHCGAPAVVVGASRTANRCAAHAAAKVEAA